MRRVGMNAPMASAHIWYRKLPGFDSVSLEGDVLHATS